MSIKLYFFPMPPLDLSLLSNNLYGILVNIISEILVNIVSIAVSTILINIM